MFNRNKEDKTITEYNDKLKQYVLESYDSNDIDIWFVKEVEEQSLRISKVSKNMRYLSGEHKIKSKQDIQYQNKTFVTKKTMFNEAKNILDFGTTYLLTKKPTFVGTEDKVKLYNKVYREGNFYNADFKIFDKTKKFGDIGEYIYLDDVKGKKVIKSYIIQPDSFYPVYNDSMELVAVIEYWFNSKSKASYYKVYTEDKVFEYTNKNQGEVYLLNTYLSYGLPIHYKTLDDNDELFGRSELDDLIPVIDDIEAIINRLGDTVHTVITNPILNISGDLKGESNEMNVAGVGYCIVTDIGGKISYTKAEMDYNCIKLYLDKVKEEIVNIGAVPSAVYGQSNYSNISETVIQQLYQIASNRAKINEMWLREGLVKRWEVIDNILESEFDIEFNEDEYIDVDFNYNRPSNDTEICDNIVKMRGINAMSHRDSIEANPLVTDVEQTCSRLEEDKSLESKKDKDESGLKGIDDMENSEEIE